jgi:subfamily B ATP-binding cassette protein MsbA
MLLLPLLNSMAARETDAVINDMDPPSIRALIEELDVEIALILFAIAFIIKGLISLASGIYLASSGARLRRSIQSRVVHCMKDLKYDYYTKKNAGFFVNLIGVQVVELLKCFFSFMSASAQAIAALVYVGIAFWLAPFFGLLAACAGISLMLLFSGANVSLRRLSQEVSGENSRYTNLVLQIIHGFKYLNATRQAEKVIDRVDRVIESMTEKQRRMGVIQSFNSNLREPFIVLIVIFIILFQINFLEKPIAPIIISLILLYRGLNSIIAAQGSWQLVLGQAGSIDMVQRVLVEFEEHREQAVSAEPPLLKEGIRFRNVCHVHDGSNVPALTGFEIVIPA